MPERGDHAEHRHACDADLHSGCPHVPWLTRTSGAATTVVDGLDAPPNDSPLCHCPCHDGCPLTASRDWPGRCTCNGTLLEVERRNRRPGPAPASVGDVAQRSGRILLGAISTATRRRRARGRAEARAAGRSSTEAQAIIGEEWVAEGLVAPVGLVLEVQAEWVTSPAGRAETARAGARLVGDLGRLPLRLRAATGGDWGQWVTSRTGAAATEYGLATGKELVAVEVARAQLPSLQVLAAQATLLPSSVRSLRLDLRARAEGTVEVRAMPVADPPGPPIGVLPTSVAGRFRPLVAAAARVGQPCTCPGVVFRARDDEWLLGAALPLRPGAVTSP